MKRHQRRVNPLGSRLDRALTSSLDATSSPPSSPLHGGKATIETALLPPAASLPSDQTIEAIVAQADHAATVAHAEPKAVYSFRLRLPGSVVSKYASAASDSNTDLEEEMESRLVRFADVPSASATPLQFSDEQRRELMQLLGSADPDSLMLHIRNLVSVSVIDASGVQVARLRLSAQQLERAAFRCIGKETLEQKLQEYAEYGINLQVGLS